ncbi:MAG TPA: signal peptidase I [Thermodesulfobacteriota bacterium]|nr:signal peptidase I [Thermodesulfobacteriota bacterium]
MDPSPRSPSRAGEPGARPVEAGAKSQLREWVETIAVFLIVFLVVRTFVVQAYKIPSGSMLPTLQIGDHILVNKFLYGIRIPWSGTRLLALRPPQRGDVVVFVPPDDPTKDFIKRIVAVPGDRVEVRAKRVYVNGELSTEEVHAVHQDGETSAVPPPALATDDCRFPRPGAEAYRDWFGPCVVPPGHYFVMGDNRDRSQDSRFWGYVPLEAIKGKAFVIYWSWDSQAEGPIWRRVRWSRIGDTIR